MHKLKTTTTANVIFSGTKDQCKMVLKAFTTYGERDDKFEIVDDNTKWMSDDLRNRVHEALLDDRLQNMFGDGSEADYIQHGTFMVGLNEMSDDELLEELEQAYETDDTLINRCNLEKLAYKP